MDHMKKKIFPLALALAGLLALAGCRGRSMDYIIENEPSIIGIVEEVRDDSVLMRVEMEGYPYGTECSVSLAVENSDSYTHLSPGDEIVVYYNGDIGESQPLEINTVYAITLRTPAERRAESDRLPMVMVDGKLYYDTGKESEIKDRCAMMDGEVSSRVEGTEVPAADDQSNFGTGYGYQYGTDDTIELLINGKWIVFEHREGDGSQVRFGDRWIDGDSLSQETLEWLDWYNGLSELDQLSVSAIPPELLDASGISGAEDAEAAAK